MREPARRKDGRETFLSSREAKSFFSSAAKWYDAFHFLLFFGKLPQYRRLAAETIRDPGPGICLDIATGTGENALAFARTHPNHRLVAFDLSRDMLDRARSKVRTEHIDFVQGTAERMPFKDRVFDLTMNSWGYRLLKPETSWREILRVTKRRGRIVDVDVLHRFLDHWFLEPLVRPCVLYQKVAGKPEPLATPQKEFFARLGLEDVRESRTKRPLGIVQVVVGTRP